MTEFYSVEATWRFRGQAVLTHVQQFTDRGAAMRAGRRLATRRRGVRVVRVIGDQTAGWLEPQVVGAFDDVTTAKPSV